MKPQEEPAKAAVTSPKEKEWYKKWWGVILAILFLPIFAIYYAWAKSNWSKGAKIAVTVVASIFLLAAIGNSNNQPMQTASNNQSNQTSQTSQQASKPAPKPATRQVVGTTTTLGAGTFTAGQDVAVGLYDVTPGTGQSGNFMVDGTDSYNEILGASGGQGVPKVRVKISDGDKVTISSLSQVTFTPVTTPFSTTHTTTTLYTGTFKVGEDIGAGRYVATPGSGESGNFMVDGSDSYNEILGSNGGFGGVPSLTVNLKDGDKITISSLSQVTLTPSS